MLWCTKTRWTRNSNKYSSCWYFVFRAGIESLKIKALRRSLTKWRDFMLFGMNEFKGKRWMRGKAHATILVQFIEITTTITMTMAMFTSKIHEKTLLTLISKSERSEARLSVSRYCCPILKYPLNHIHLLTFVEMHVKLSSLSISVMTFTKNKEAYMYRNFSIVPQLFVGFFYDVN